MNKGLITVVSMACLLLVTDSVINYFDNKNELLALEITKKKLSIKILERTAEQGNDRGSFEPPKPY